MRIVSVLSFLYMYMFFIQGVCKISQGGGGEQLHFFFWYPPLPELFKARLRSSMLLVNELHLIQYYYKIMNTRIYNTVNVSKRMLHKCVNTEVIVGSL